jgi:hypothetical protein
MKTKQIQPSYQVISKGIDSLIKEIGPKGTMEFFRFFYPGRGDSVREFKELWKQMKIEEIHREILKAKKKKEI